MRIFALLVLALIGGPGSSAFAQSSEEKAAMRRLTAEQSAHGTPVTAKAMRTTLERTSHSRICSGW